MKEFIADGGYIVVPEQVDEFIKHLELRGTKCKISHTDDLGAHILIDSSCNNKRLISGEIIV